MITEIKLAKVPEPKRDCGKPILLDEETIKQRRVKVLAKMQERKLDKLIVYGDVEHGNNFMYLTGYFTRFEEALMIIDKNGEIVLALGNENLNKADKARVAVSSIHTPQFSLPNQPDIRQKTIKELLMDAGIKSEQRIGVAGWKNFVTTVENGKYMFDLPSYIIDAVRDIIGEKVELTNETDIFIGENGVRTTNNANEVAHYEYGASLASDCILDAMNRVEEGVSELELGDSLVRYGQHTNIVTIAASGARFVKGNMFPITNKVKKGDPVSLTVGYSGGSSSRTGIAVETNEELPEGQKDYLERIAIPYFRAYVTWLENVRIGMNGDEVFRLIENVLPRKNYGWSLCPGHLTAEEEWMASPIYEGSQEILKSGMICQIDIIPSVSGYFGTCAESTVVLASKELKAELAAEYPEVFARMQERRDYIENVLGIQLSEDILPMCSTVAYLRPFMLDHDSALVQCR